MRKSFLNETKTEQQAATASALRQGASFTSRSIRRQWRAQSPGRTYWSGQNLMFILGSPQSDFPSTKYRYEVVVHSLHYSLSTPLTILFLIREQRHRRCPRCPRCRHTQGSWSHDGWPAAFNPQTHLSRQTRPQRLYRTRPLYPPV